MNFESYKPSSEELAVDRRILQMDQSIRLEPADKYPIVVNTAEELFYSGTIKSYSEFERRLRISSSTIFCLAGLITDNVRRIVRDIRPLDRADLSRPEYVLYLAYGKLTASVLRFEFGTTPAENFHRLERTGSAEFKPTHVPEVYWRRLAL